MGKEDEESRFSEVRLQADLELNEPDFLAETAEKDIDASVAPLLLIYSYLKQLANPAKTRSKRPPVSFSLAEFGTITDLAQKDFQTEQLFSDAGSEVSLKFRLTRKQSAKVEYPLFEDDKDVPTLLRHDGVIVLSSRVRISSKNQSILSMDIAGDIPVLLVFRGQVGADHLLIKTRNTGSIGVSSYRIEPKQVDEAFFVALDQFLGFENQDFLKLLEKFDADKATVVPPPKLEQTLQSDPVSANILTFDLSQRPHQKTLTLVYQEQECLFQVNSPVCRIGRRMPADIQVRSRFVSREHATIILEKKQFTLRDHSSNGTYVRPDGKPTFMLHHASQKLSGKGVISLGEEISADNPDLIYYDID